MRRSLVDATPNHPLAILVDARAVYWVDEGGIHAIGKSDGKRDELALFDNSLAVPVAPVKQVDQSADYVVWTGRDGLSKVRK